MTARISRFLLPIFLLGGSTQAAQPPDGSYREAALRAARWIQSQEIRLPRGKAWAVHAEDKQPVPNLYSGAAGVVLFFLELHDATGDRSFLDEAKAGALYLLSSVEAGENTLPVGLYTGLAGIGFTLQETYRATGETRFRQGALRCVRALHRRAKRVGRGIEWNGVTDIIGGSAGVGLFLLYAARELEHPPSLQLAIQAGERLIEVAKPVETGLKWAMSDNFERLMPNFSHGTAGNAYFLAALHAATGRPGFLQAALKGTRYLLSVADKSNDACLIFHHEPGGEDLYYLGWCHGPVGTARLYYILWKETGQPEWLQWLLRSARGVMQSGIPEQQTPGFWNNVGQCCGSAGVAEFMLDLHRVLGRPDFLQMAQRMTADLMKRSSPGEPGTKWVQAEHRVQPDLLLAQTGYMQGAAGIGMLLLHLDGLERQKSRLIRLPDSPY